MMGEFYRTLNLLYFLIIDVLHKRYGALFFYHDWGSG